MQFTKDTTSGLIEVLELFETGKIIPSANKAFDIFNAIKPYLMIRYSGAYKLERYFRIRRANEDHPFPLERKELFHIPLRKNYLVGPERYSMPGHPCLYLSSQAELCWYECGKPEKFAIARFDIPQTENSNLKMIDFSARMIMLKYDFDLWLRNYTEDRDTILNYLVKNLLVYPLRAACSVVVEHADGKFKEEYIISQFLLQWVRNDNDFDGIQYESCNEDDAVRSRGGHNVVLVTKQFDDDGYDIKMRNAITVSEPIMFDISTITVAPSLEDCLLGRTIQEVPDLWGFESIPSIFEQI